MNGDSENTIHQGPAAAHVVVIGVGGLGCPAAVALARGGVGTITLVDPDRVESSNLPRQLLHREQDIGQPKVESAAAKLHERFPRLTVRRRFERFASDNAAQVLIDADFAIDATDGSQTKLLINDTAVRGGVPFCYAGVVGTSGQAMAIIPGRTPCLRCLFPGMTGADDGATCSRAGIVGPMAGIFGALQANLALAHLNGQRAKAGRLISYDRSSDRWRDLAIATADRCELCESIAPKIPDSEGERPRWVM